MGMMNRTKNASGVQTREDMMRNNSTGSKYQQGEFNFKRKKKKKHTEEDEEEYAYVPTKRDILESKYANRDRQTQQLHTQHKHLDEIVSSAVKNPNTTKLLNRHNRMSISPNSNIEETGRDCIISVLTNSGEEVGYIQNINPLGITTISERALKVNFYDSNDIIDKLSRQTSDYTFRSVRSNFGRF